MKPSRFGQSFLHARLALIIHGTSGWLVSMDGLGCGVALAG